MVSSARRSGTNVTWSGRSSKRERDDLRLDGQLQVEPNLDRLAKQAQVAVLDVPAVFAEVDRDPVGAAQLGQHGRPDRVRLAPASGLPERGDMIDVDTQARHDCSSPKGGSAGGAIRCQARRCRPVVRT